MTSEENDLTTTHRLLRRAGAAALAVTFGLAPVLVGGVAQAAAPAGFSVDVTPTTGLSDGDKVTVTLGPLAAGEGVYVMYCVESPAGDRAGRIATDECGGADWIQADSGRTSSTITVAAQLGDTDCTTDVCGIHVFRDRFDFDDTSYDTFVPLGFAEDAPGGDDGDDKGGDKGGAADDEDAGFAVDVSRTTELQDGDVVDVTLTGLPRDVGLYVQYCVQQPGGQRAVGDQCAGAGTWALGDNPYGEGVDSPVDGPIVDPADGPFPTTVSTTIGSVDCTQAVCGIQTRRDHRGGGDSTYDTFTPVSFAADAVVDLGGEEETTDPTVEPAAEQVTGAHEEIAATGASTGTLALVAALLITVGAVTVTAARRAPQG